MSDITFVINTLGRVNKQITLKNLPKEVRDIVFLSVQEQEKDLYGDQRLIVLPPHIKDLPATRQWLIDNVSTRYLVIMDDDLSFFTRRDNIHTKLHKVEPDEISAMFKMIENKLYEYPMVGISSREGNNHVVNNEKEVGRSMRIFGLDLQVVKLINARFDRTKTKEDMDMTLQILRAGYCNLVSYKWANDHVSSNAPGGCALYRTLELMKSDAEILKKLHPEFVTVVEKTTKTSWGGCLRTDVRIQWKKAYNSSTK